MDAGNDSTTDTGDGRWLTYGELAAIRRIDRHSAVKLVMRHGWRRQKDNRGALRILVPPEWAPSKDMGTDTINAGTDLGTDKGTDAGTDISRAISALDAAVASITVRAENAEKRADLAEIRANRAENRANQVEQALAEERKRAELAENARDTLEGEIKGTRIAQAKADAVAAESRETVLKAEHDRAAAVTIADEAVKAAEELRRAAAARLGQGRWARLRAAWRGE